MTFPSPLTGCHRVERHDGLRLLLGDCGAVCVCVCVWRWWRRWRRRWRRRWQSRSIWFELLVKLMLLVMLELFCRYVFFIAEIVVYCFLFAHMIWVAPMFSNAFFCRYEFLIAVLVAYWYCFAVCISCIFPSCIFFALILALPFACVCVCVCVACDVLFRIACVIYGLTWCDVCNSGLVRRVSEWVSGCFKFWFDATGAFFSFNWCRFSNWCGECLFLF